MTGFARATVIGIATGLRSSIGIAAIVTPRGPGAMTARAGLLRQAAALVAVAGELTVDKLPNTPSRLEKPGLIARVGVGVVAGALLARRAGARGVTGALAGGAGALAGSYGGAEWRAQATRRFGQDLPGALAEDVAALVIGHLAVNG